MALPAVPERAKRALDNASSRCEDCLDSATFSNEDVSKKCAHAETRGVVMDRSLEDLRRKIRALYQRMLLLSETPSGDPWKLLPDIEPPLRELASREGEKAKGLIEDIRKGPHHLLELHGLCTELLREINATDTAEVPIRKKTLMARNEPSDAISNPTSRNDEKARRRLVSVTFSVDVPEESDDVYMASSFNGWNPAATCLLRFDARERVFGARTTVDLLEGEAVEYKYTRGSWQTVETTADQGDVPNRRLQVLYRHGGSMEVSDTVDAWKDTRPLTYGPKGVSIASPDKATQALFDALSTREDVLPDRCEHCHTKYPVKRRGSMMHIRSILQKRLESYQHVRYFRLEDMNLREAVLLVWFPEHATMFSLCRSGDTFLACGPEDWDEIS